MSPRSGRIAGPTLGSPVAAAYVALSMLVASLCVVVAAGDAQSAPSGPGQWPSESPPRPLPARDVRFPPYEIRTLENGLQVVAVLHHEQPVVSMRMIVRAGAAHDPREKLGLANLAATLLDQGTTTKSARELNEEIDFIGGAMGAGAGTDLTFVNVVVMKDSFEWGLRRLSEVARQPAFAPEEIERQRQQVLSSLQVSLEDPEYVANAVFDRLVYGFHPYGMPQSGTPGTLASITRQDLVEYHRKYFAPNNAILAIVGDVTTEEAFDGVRKVFGDWARRDVPQASFGAPPDPTRRVVVVNKPDAVQTEVRVGHLGVRRNNSDYMALNLTLRILGGEGANRLHQVLRTERGLTYGVKADMDALFESGDFEAATNTRSDATGEVLRLVVDEFWRLQRERVSERELGDAKAYLAGSFPLTIETPDSIATQVLNVLFFGLPVEQLQSFRNRVNAVRVDDIERVARYFLRPDRLSIVLVGNAAAFVSKLPGVGFGTFEIVEMADLNLMAPDFKGGSRARAPAGPGRPAGPPGLRPAQYVPTHATPGSIGSPGRTEVPLQFHATALDDPSRRADSSQSPAAAPGAAARALLDRVIAAKGGRDRLRGIHRLKAAARAEAVDPTGTSHPVDTVTYLQYPDRLRIETTLHSDRGPVTMVQVFDGARGWVKDPSGIHDVPERMIRDLHGSLRRDTVAALLAADEGTLRVRVLPDVRDGSARLTRVLELSGAGFDPMVVFVSPETHLIARQTYVAGAAGEPLVEESFEDYRNVEGVQIAFMARVRIGGRPMLERRVTAITFNPPFVPSLFQRPSS
jgi:zinc protease